MLKIHERKQPDSCWNKAKDDEILFVIRSKDRAMSSTIRAWVDFRIKLGLNQSTDEQIQEALITASIVEKIQG